MEPRTSRLPIARAPGDSPQGERLLVASRLASTLVAAHQPRTSPPRRSAVAEALVAELG